MLTVLDRDTPQPKDRLPPSLPPHLEPSTFQEPRWLWFTLLELGFPLLMDEFLKPIHPEIEEYMRRHARYNSNNGAFYMKSNADSVKNTTKQGTYQNPRTRSRV